MYQATYNDKVYEAQTERGLFLQLRSENRLTYEEVGQIVGKSRQWVGHVIGSSNGFDYPELDDPTLYASNTDLEIALMLKVPTGKVSSARRRLGIKPVFRVNLNRRRERLALYLFGRLPGPQFISFLETQVKQLPSNKVKILDEFYLQGLVNSPADNVNIDADRVYRHLAKKELKKLTDGYLTEELVEQGVITWAKK